MSPASIAGLDGIVIDIAPGSGPNDHPSTFVWTSAGRRRHSADIVIAAGRDDEAPRVESGSMTALMDDRLGDLSPRNVLGRWYGDLGRGTPAQVRWSRTTDGFTRAAVAGGWGTNADGFAWSSTNSTYLFTDGTRAVTALPSNFAAVARLVDAGSPDAEVVWSFSVPVAPTGSNATVGGLLRYSTAGNCVVPLVELTPSGNVQVQIMDLTDNFASFSSGSVVVTTATTNQTIWGKARAEGAAIMLKAWVGDRDDEPAVWHVLATDTKHEGPGVGLFPWRRATNVGTYTMYIDDFEVHNLLWIGTVPEWAPRWPDKSGADQVAPIEAAGILRQITTRKGTVESPLRRQLGRLSYAKLYLPLEDDGDATRAGSGITNGKIGTVTDGTFASDDTLPGSAPTLVLNTAGSSRVSATALPGVTNGYAVMVFFKCGSAVAAERNLLEIRATGTVTRWEVYVNGSAYGFRGYSESGALLADSSATYGGAPPTDWTAMQLETEVSGGTVTATLIWHNIYDSVSLFANDTYSGSASAVVSAAAVAVTDQMSVAHLWAGDDALPFVDATFRRCSIGYTGEEAAARVARLCSEAGMVASVLSGSSEPMGPQKPATLQALLEECQDADLGLVYERATSLGYRPRTRRYRPAVALALDWAAGDLDDDPEPQDGDQRLVNDWTVNRKGGSYAVARDADSIAREGLHDDEHDMNIESDDRLQDFADWLLSQGTDDQIRWPRIRINLVAHPELIPAWLACDVGSRVTVDNCPIPGVLVDLIIEGYRQEINVDKWIVEMSCSPASWWHVGRYDDTEGLSKYQLRTGTLATSYGSSATSMTVLTTEDDETLSQTSAYDITVAGEVIGVPIGGAAARTGSSGAWSTSLTGLTRGKNGISKNLPAGSVVKITDSGRYAA